MTVFCNNPSKVRGSISKGISSGHGIVKIRPAMKDGREDLILKLRNVFYLLNSPSNLVNLGLLNDAGIYHNNENQAHFDKISWKFLTFV